MHFASPPSSKILSVDKNLFETNLMGAFLVKSISSHQTEGYLEWNFLGKQLTVFSL